jgi:hypothetical protein
MQAAGPHVCQHMYRCTCKLVDRCRSKVLVDVCADADMCMHAAWQQAVVGAHGVVSKLVERLVLHVEGHCHLSEILYKALSRDRRQWKL